MPTFIVHMSAPVTTAVEVEAGTPEQAEKIAAGQAPTSLCHQCAREMNPPDDWTVESVERADDQ